MFSRLSVAKSVAQKSFRLHESKVRKPIRRSRAAKRLHFDLLEDRTAPATFADVAPNLNLALDANENVAIVSTGAQYSLTLTGGNWTGTDNANVTGNGTATLTVTAAGLAAFSDINLSDTAAGVSVDFNDSGANLYSDNFTIELDNGALLPTSVRFSGATHFGAAAKLSATTDSGVRVFAGAALSSTDGDIDLTGNSQANRAGAFMGIQVSGTVTSTGTGSITLIGTGGNSPADSFLIGVDVDGSVTTTGTGSISVIGTGGGGTSSNYGALVAGGGLISSASNGIAIIGIGGAGTADFNIGVGVFNGGKIASVTGGSIAIVALGGTGTQFNDGVRIDGAASSITSFDGAIDITGDTLADGFGIDLTSSSNILVTGAGNVSLNADSMNLTGTSINAGGNDVVLLPTSAATVIDLGGADATGRLGLTDAELDTITAGRLFVGNPSSTGGIEITAAIAPANSNVFLLNTSAAIVDLNANGTDIVVQTLTLTAETGIGTAIDALEIDVVTVQAFNGINGGVGDINLADVAGGIAINNVTNVGGDIEVEALGGDLSFDFLNGVAGRILLTTDGAIVANAFSQILAGELALDASTGVGTAVAPVGTVVGTVSAFTDNGGVFVANVGSLIVGDITVFGITITGISGGGDAVVSAASPLTVNSPIVMSGDITLTAGEIGDAPVWADDLTINALVQSTGGSIVLHAGDDIIFNSVIPQAANLGTVTAEAGFGDVDGRGVVVVNGTTLDDTLVLSVDGLGVTQFELNGSNEVGLPNLVQFGFAGGDGDDRFVVNYVGGDPVPVDGVGFDGGNQNNIPGDRLTLIGSGVEDGTYTPDATTPGSGVVDVAGKSIGFRNIEPVEVSTFLSFTLLLPNDGDNVEMLETQADFDADPNTALEDGLRFRGASGNVDFESLDVRNVTQVIVDTSLVDTAGAPDTITLTSGANAHLNRDLFVFTGSNGEDTVVVNGPVTFNRDTFSASTIQIVSNGTIALNAPLSAGHRLNAGGTTVTLTGFVDLTARTTLAGVIGITGAGNGADIFADSVALWANNDIGDFANNTPVRTEAFDLANFPDIDLEARSNLGGILLVNAGNLSVGNVDFGFNLNLVGITAFGGDVNLFNFGSIQVNRDFETVFADGDITIIAENLPAFGITGEIFLGGQSGDRTQANVFAAVETQRIGATVLLRADGDILLGNGLGWGDVFNPEGDLTLIQADFDNDAVGDVFVTQSTLVRVRGELNVSGANIFINNTAITFSALQTFGGDILLTSREDGVVSIIVGGVADAGLNINSTVDTTQNGQVAGGNIVVVADDVELVAGGAGILALDAGTGNVGIFLVTQTHAIELGDTIDLDRLNLNNDEFQLIAGSIVRVGGDATDPIGNPPTNTGDIFITEAIAAPVSWNTLALRTAGVITEDAAAGLDLANLLLVGLGGVNLCDGTNNIVVLAGLTDAGNSFKVANNFTGTFIVGDVDGVFGFATSGGDVTLFAPDAGLAILQSINAGDPAIVRLTTGHGIIQNALGFIVAASLGVRNEGAAATGNIDLVAGNNQLGVFAAFNETANGTVTLLAKTFGPANTLAIGSVAADGTCFTLTTGVTTTTGDFTILVFNGNLTEGKLLVDELVDLGTGVARLYAIAGIEDTGGGFTASAVSALNGGQTGNIFLGGVNNVATFAVYNNALDGDVVIANEGDLVMGVVAENNILPELSGLQAQNGDAILQANAGSISLTASVVVGDGSVALLAFNGITQGVDGRIIARSLAAENSDQGDILLDNADNFVNVFAASTLVPGTAANGLGRIVFANSIGFVVDEVNLTALGGLSISAYEQTAGFTPFDNNVTGIETVGGNVDLSAGGAVDIQAPIDALAGIVTLTAVGGVNQLAGGIITTSQLGVINSGSGDIFLFDVNQVDGKVGFENSAKGGAVYFKNDFDIEIGGIAGSTLFAGVDGVTTDDGVAAIATDGSISITAPIDVGTSRVLLQSTKGITQTGNGSIDANALSVATVAGVNAATGSIVLDGKNTVNDFAGHNAAAAGTLVFRNSKSLNVTAVASVAGVLAGTVGASSNAGAIVLDADGSIKLTNAVVVNNGGADVFLKSVGGIEQADSGPISARGLSVENTGNGNVLLSAGNAVTQFAGSNQALLGSLTLRSLGNLEVASIAALAGLTNKVDGVTTASGSVALTVSGKLTVSQAINAGAGAETVRLHTQGGVTQAAAGIITANALGIENVGGNPTTGAIDLLSVNNVKTLAVNNAADGAAVSFRNSGSLNVDSVAALTGFFGGVTGTSASNGAVTILTNQALTLSQQVSAGSGTVRLFTTQGVNQLAAGKILADALAVENKAGTAAAAGDINLSATNTIAKFTAYNSAVGGKVTLVNSQGLTIDQIGEVANVFEQTSGVFANSDTDGAIALTVPGVLTLKSFLLSKTVLHGNGTGGLSLQHTGTFERVDHVLSGAGSGSISWAANGFPIMTMTYDGLANAGPINDQQKVVDRTFTITVSNKTTDIAAVTGSTTTSRINTTDNSTMRVDFLNPISGGGASLQVKIASAFGAGGDTVNANDLRGSANASISFHNLAGKVNIPVGTANPEVAVRFVGGDGIDLFAFDNDAAIAWTKSLLPAIDGGASLNNILDVFFSDPAVVVDLANGTASNVNRGGSNGLSNIGQVINK